MWRRYLDVATAIMTLGGEQRQRALARRLSSTKQRDNGMAGNNAARWRRQTSNSVISMASSGSVMAATSVIVAAANQTLW